MTGHFGSTTDRGDGIGAGCYITVYVESDRSRRIKLDRTHQCARCGHVSIAPNPGQLRQAARAHADLCGDER